MKRPHSSPPARLRRRLVTTSLLLATLFLGVHPAAADTPFPTAAWPSTGTNPVATAINVVTGKVYVANQGSDSVTVYDPATGTASAVTLAASSAPVAVAVDPTSNLLYVANSGTNNVAVIDAGHGNAVSYVTVGTNPVAVAVNAAAHKVYVVNKGSDNVTVIDAGNGNAVTTVTVGSKPMALAVDATTDKAYVVNQGDCVTAGSVTIISGTTGAAPVPVGVCPQAVAVNPVTGKAYVPNKTDGTVTVIVNGTAGSPAVTVGSNPVAVAVNPVTNMAYVVNQGNGIAAGTVTTIDGNETTALVSAGVNPQAVSISVLTNRVYVTNQTAGRVTVIDAANANATTVVTVGTTPGPLAYDPIRNRIYVVNVGSNNLAILDGAVGSESDPGSDDGAGPVVVNPITHMVYMANRDGNSVTRINGVTYEVSSMLLRSQPSRLAINPITNKVYIGTLSGQVMVLSADRLDRIRLSQNYVWDLAVNPVINKVYLATTPSSGNGALIVIDAGNDNDTTTIPAGSSPHGVAVNPVTNRVYLTDNVDNSVKVYDGATNQLLTTITAGLGAGSVAVNPTTNKIYVSDTTSHDVTVIDGATNTVIATLGTIGSVQDFSVDPVQNRIYVSVSGARPGIIDNSEVFTQLPDNGVTCLTVYADPVTGRLFGGCARAGTPVFATYDGAGTYLISTAAAYHPLDVQIAADPMLGKVYSKESGSIVWGVLAEKNLQAIPLTVTVTPLAGDTATAFTPAIDYQVTSTYAPITTSPNKVYYQVDTWTGTWQVSTPSPSTGTISLPGLSRGLHTLYLFAGDGQEGGGGSSGGGSPVLGAMQAYTFLANPPAADGTGTVTITNSPVMAGVSNATVDFTYQAPSVGYVANGSVQITPPGRWGAPASCSGATVTGGNILASSLNVNPGQTATFSCTWTTSPTVGTDTFTTSEASTASGTLTALAGSPTVTVNYAPDGSGTLTVSPTTQLAGDTGRTLTLTYTAAPGGLISGELDIALPSGWSGGSVSSDIGTAALNSGTIQVTGITLGSGQAMTITVSGATVGTTFGTDTFSAAAKSTAGGSLAALAGSPVVTVDPSADGSGTLTVSPTTQLAGDTGRTLTLTYTAAPGGLISGELDIALPSGWSGGSVSSDTGTAALNSGTIRVTGITLAGSGTMTITYSDATVGSTLGANTFATTAMSTAGGSLVALASSPTVTVTTPTPPSNGGGGTTQTTGPGGHTTVTVTETGDTALTTITSDTNLKLSVGGVASVDLPAGSVSASSDGTNQGGDKSGGQSAPPVSVQIKLSILPLAALPGTTGNSGGEPGRLPAHLKAHTAIELNATLTTAGSSSTQAVHQLAGPVTITFKVSPEVLAQAAQTVVAYYNPDLKVWVQLPITIDAATGTITITVSHFTTFAVFTSDQSTSRLTDLSTKGAVARASGTALQGTKITVYDNGKALTAVTLPASGIWSLGASLEPGVNRLVVVAAEAAGTIGLGETTVTYQAPPAPTVPPAPAPTPDPAPAPSGFSDLAGYDWATAAVKDLAGRQIMAGYADGTFRPGSSVTRAVFVDSLVKALGLKAGTTLHFTDTAEIPTELRASVAIAVANGLLTGFPDGSLRPNDLLTRAQAAVLLERALKLVPVPLQSEAVRLKDADALPAWAATAIATIAGHGLIKGYDDGAFHPNDTLTRAQVAVLVERYVQLLEKR